MWLAAHTSIHGLLEREWANERQQVAAVMWRVARFPSECIHKLGGTHRLTAAHVAAIRHDSGELMRALMQAIESDDGSAHGTPHGIPRSGAAARKRTRGRLPIHTAHAVAALRSASCGRSQRDGDAACR